MAFQRNSSSSSSSSSFSWSYDVFVSYAGEDSKRFKDHLIKYLTSKGISIFKDDKSERGQSLPVLLASAIEGSRTSIIVFSENYAESQWCLNELVKILECRESNHQLVLPIFFKVEPSFVRKQEGKYGEAMTRYGENQSMDQLETVKNWKKALRTAANITGWEVKVDWDHRNEAQFIDEIAKEVSRQIAYRSYFYVAEHPVGLEHPVRELNSILDVGNDKNDVRVVVVFGPQGIGKTTIVNAAYNSNAHHFQGTSFLANVSESLKQPNGVLKMQKTLLSEILRDQTYKNVRNVDKGITLIKERLGNLQVLLVFDDVDSLDDLQSLAHKPSWFGKGSRILVTTRDQNLLKFRDFPSVSTYEVKRLDDHEALKLLCWNAFRTEAVQDGFEERVNRAVRYANGFPSKLIELGNDLHERSKDEWDIELNRYNNTIDKVQKVNLHSDLPSSSTQNSLSIDNYANVSQHKESDNMIISQDDKGKIRCLLSARQLTITWSDDSKFWSWISLENQRFSEVAKLIVVYYLNIKGKIHIEKLSSRTTYAVYFVFQFKGSIHGFKERAVKLVANCKGTKSGGERSAFLDPPRNEPQLCRKREDGWMEIKMGEFFIEDGDRGEIECCLTEHDTSVKKTGLIVGGIEFRPEFMEHDSMVSRIEDYHTTNKVYTKTISRDDNQNICFMLLARKLTIAWSENSKYWRWISKPESRFSEVAKLIEVNHFDIKGEIESKNLSSATSYVVYFVFKFEDGPILGFNKQAIELTVNYGSDEEIKHSEFLDPPKDVPKLWKEREDGWREIFMGKFHINDGDVGRIKCHLMEHDVKVRKTGLIVGGIEFRPA